jgi:Flp pilus assembly protein TadD
VDNEQQKLPDAAKNGYEKAARLIKEGDFGKARNELERLLEEHPLEPRLVTLLGNTYFESGEDLEKAEKCYREALGYEPDYAPALTNLGMLFIHQKRFDEAVEYARRAIQKHPRDPRSWITLGMYYAFKGQIETALGYLLAAYSHDNQYTIAAYNAACVLIELERYEEALYYLEISLADGEFYEDALNDPSLDPIRDEAEFKRIMSESRKRSETPNI